MTAFMVENYLTGDSFICYTAEKAKEQMIKILTDYWNEDKYVDQESLQMAIDDVVKQSDENDGYVDNDDFWCYQLPIIE